MAENIVQSALSKVRQTANQILRPVQQATQDTRGFVQQGRFTPLQGLQELRQAPPVRIAEAVVRPIVQQQVQRITQPVQTAISQLPQLSQRIGAIKLPSAYENLPPMTIRGQTVQSPFRPVTVGELAEFSRENIIQPFAREAVEIPLTVKQAITKRPEEIQVPKTPAGRFFFGQEPLQSAQVRFPTRRLQLEQLGVSRELSGPLAVGAIVAGSYLDLLPGVDDLLTKGVKKGITEVAQAGVKQAVTEQTQKQATEFAAKEIEQRLIAQGIERQAAKTQAKTEAGQLVASRVEALKTPGEIKPPMLRGAKGLTESDIKSQLPNIRTRTNIPAKDVYGNKVQIPAGEALTPYELKGNKVLLQDGQPYLVNKNQYQNIKNQSVTAEAKPFAPEVVGLEETRYGGKNYVGVFVDFAEDDPEVLKSLPENVQKIVTDYFWSENPEDYSEITKFVKKLNKIGWDADYDFNGINSLFKLGTGEPTKFQDYTLPNAENYQEILLKKPDTSKFEVRKVSDYYQAFVDGKPVGTLFDTKEQATKSLDYSKSKSGVTYQSAHWDENNVISHLRTNERTYNNKKVLFMEELQSDWARDVRSGKTQATTPELKNWQEITLKRALQEANNTGADYFAWINGNQTTKRYDLEQVLNSVNWKSNPELKTKIIDVYVQKREAPITVSINEAGKIVSSTEESLKGNSLDAAFGKGLADKIMSSDDGKLAGEGLKFGGEWANNLYDKQVRDIVQKLTGEKIELLDLGLGGKQMAIQLTPEVKQKIAGVAPEITTSGKKFEEIIPQKPDEVLTTPTQLVTTEPITPTPVTPAQVVTVPQLQETTWFRGINKLNKGQTDKFYSAAEEVAQDYADDAGKVITAKPQDLPKNPLVATDKTELAEIIEYKGDPFVQPISMKREDQFDTQAKKYAQSRGFDSIYYLNGSLDEPELHVFGKQVVTPTVTPAQVTPPGTVLTKQEIGKLQTKTQADREFNEWSKSLEDEINGITRHGKAVTVEPTFKTQQKVQLKTEKDRLREEMKNFDEWSKQAFGDTNRFSLSKALETLGKSIQKNTNLGYFNMNNADSWRDKSVFSLARETMVRNFEDVMGGYAKEMRTKLLDPVFKAVADENRFLKREKNEIKNLGIKARSKESELVQLYGEGKINLDELKTRTLNPEKIVNASNVLRAKYDQYLEMINKTLTRNGYDPIPKRKDYFRHFQEMSNVFEEIGTALKAEDLPTDINGLSAGFKPGKNFFASALPRFTDFTEYDAITGIEKYLDGAAKQIYRTDAIQNLRNFETALREKYAGTRHLTNFTAELGDYINKIAGKKSGLDRSAERAFGRGVFTLANVLKRQTGANLTGANIATALTQFIPFTQSLATTDKRDFMRGMLATIKSIGKDDGFVGKSDFLTSRFGVDRLSMNAFENVADKTQYLSRIVDNFVSQTVVRSKYLEALRKGSTPENALKIANDWGQRIIGGRSVGEMPSYFDSQTLGFLTQFQLEANNLLSFIGKDIPRNFSRMGAVNAMMQLALYSYIYNNVYEQLTGRRPAFDPIGTVENAYEDYTNPTMSDQQATQNLVKSLSNQLPFVSLITEGGRIPVSGAIPDIPAVIAGEKTLGEELAKPLQYVLPGGGGQIRKTVQGVEVFQRGASVTPSGMVRFPIEQTPENFLKTALFGQYSTPEGQEYIRSGFKKLSEKESQVFENMRTTNPDQAVEYFQTVMREKDAKREAEILNESTKPESKLPETSDLTLIESKLDSAPSFVTPAEISTYYLRDLNLNQTGYQKNIEDKKFYSRLSSLENRESLSADQKTSAIDLMLQKNNVSRADYDYYKLAKDLETNENKTLYVQEQIGNIVRQGGGPQQIYDFLANNQLSVRGNKIATSGVLKELVDSGIITEFQADQLKNLEVSGNYNTPIITAKAPKSRKLRARKPRMGAIKAVRLKQVKLPKPKAIKLTPIKPVRFAKLKAPKISRRTKLKTIKVRA